MTAAIDIAPALPRILLAAPKSGSGKTVFVCGLLRALQARGQTPASFKCGPDYIDPAFHRRVLGIPCRNLDLYLSDSPTVRQTFAFAYKAAHASLAVVEGAMGYYDGLGGTSTKASSYDVARAIDSPVIMVVDARGTSLTLAAQIKGLLDFTEDHRIAAIVLNRCTERTAGMLEGAISHHCGIPVLGYLPEIPECHFESRHLGLVQASEVSGLLDKIDSVSDAIARTVDVDRLIGIARSAPALPDAELLEQAPAAAPVCRSDDDAGRPIVAVARDEAFSFYYQENLETLRSNGARIVEFSPLVDERLPEGSCACYLGGGYPELYLDRLSANKSMIGSIRDAHAAGMPIFAECGGYLYLQRGMYDKDGAFHPLLAIIDGTARLGRTLGRFGYVEVSPRGEGGGPFIRQGETLRAHEFHYCLVDGVEGDFDITKPTTGSSWSDGVQTPTLLAGFAHFYLPGCPSIARRLVAAARGWRDGRASSAPAAAAPPPACFAAASPSIDPAYDRDPPVKQSPREAEFAALVASIAAPDSRIAKEAQAVWDTLAKPIGGLGVLEDAVCRICAVRADLSCPVQKKAVAVFCADNGVVAQGVTQTGPEVTGIVAANIAEGCSTVCKMAEVAGADVVAVDMGMASMPTDPRIRSVHIANGTADCSSGPAMTRTQAIDAVLAGAALASELADGGYDLLACGEMGIGNTTTASALACALLDLDPADVVGPGAGLPPQKVAHKVEVVRRALARNAPFSDDPLDILAKLGGFDIAGMAGFYLGCAASCRPCIVDGLISAIAALMACRICPNVQGALIASHASSEPASNAVLCELGLCPPIRAGMHLGEGTGAVACMPLIDMAVGVWLGRGTFVQNGIEPYERFDGEARP